MPAGHRAAQKCAGGETLSVQAALTGDCLAGGAEDARLTSVNFARSCFVVPGSPARLLRISSMSSATAACAIFDTG